MVYKKAAKQLLFGKEITREEWEDQIIRMIVSLRLPLRYVGNIELQRSYKALDKTAELPSANTVRNRIKASHDKIRPILLEKFPRDGTNISLSCDG